MQSCLSACASVPRRLRAPVAAVVFTETPWKKFTECIVTIAKRHFTSAHYKEQAEERGLKVTTGKIPMGINARYLAEHPGESGLCKVVVEESTRRLLGVHMIGGACSEMIFGAAVMLETELREKEIEEIVFPHPTASEIIKDVFMSVR